MCVTDYPSQGWNIPSRRNDFDYRKYFVDQSRFDYMASAHVMFDTCTTLYLPSVSATPCSSKHDIDTCNTGKSADRISIDLGFNAVCVQMTMIAFPSPNHLAQCKNLC